MLLRPQTPGDYTKSISMRRTPAPDRPIAIGHRWPVLHPNGLVAGHKPGCPWL